LGFEVQKNENSLIFDCYLVYELELMGKMSAALGEDSSRWERAREVRKAYIADHYFNEDGLSRRLDGSLVDTQTSYVLPLAFDVLDDALKSKVLQQLVRVAERPGASDDGKYYPEYSLMTGFIGTPWITYALSENGRADLAYKMLLNNTFPSWLYPVTQGATTIWERLNSLTAEDGFGGNNSMNSFNHYAFGSVLDWMMERSLGIDQDESSPGFHHFYLRPVPDPSGGLKEASGWYDSPYGRICSSWKRSGNKLRYKFTVPANTTATLILPGEDPRELVAGEYEFGTKF
ncbi:MAG: alpha-L-rhamnosidase C-terminal domain-containing protein, partial [Candidatus Cryptobacteroides sp.]|nr:alpha-L-rhamnosidase C-terminal domain-containing protein [Bacteroidales bacterium]MDY6157596.1 alpha-L-rhamnosidase C-terminal domain-containing protein [Candidatus Cryptobacteroides sp.]